MATRNFMFDIQMMTAVDPDRNRRVSPLQLIQGDDDFSVTLRDSNAAATVSGNTYRMTIKGTVSGGALAISNDVSPTTNTFTMTMLTDTVGMRDFLDGFDARRGVLEIEDVTGGSLVQTLAQVDVLVIGRFYDGSETAPYTQAQSNMTATTDPTVNDDAGDGYGGWSCWYNVTGKKNWTCTDPTAGAAVWVQIPVSLANYLMLSGGSLTPLTDTQILILKMIESQTAVPFEVRDSDNNLKASIDADGKITVAELLMGSTRVYPSGSVLKTSRLEAALDFRAPALKSKGAVGGALAVCGEYRTSDAAPGEVSVTGQSALPAASTNQDGGDLVIAPGAKATGGGDNGKVIIKNAAKDTELFCFSNAGGQAVAHVDLGTQGAGTLALDLNNAQSQEVTFTASTVTLSIANAAAANSKTINLLIDASGASTVITFPAGWLWQDADPGTPTVSDGDSAILSVQSMGTAIVACYKGLVT